MRERPEGAPSAVLFPSRKTGVYYQYAFKKVLKEAFNTWRCGGATRLRAGPKPWGVRGIIPRSF